MAVRTRRARTHAALVVYGAVTCVTLISCRPAEPPARPPASASAQPVVNGVARARDARRGVFPFDRVVVVTIAIDRHPNALSPCDLKFPEAQAKALEELFADKFSYEVVPLHGTAATRDRIWSTLDRYKAELGPKDALIVYFAGHGQVVELPSAGQAGYLVASDSAVDVRDKTDHTRWEREAINMRAFVERVDALPAGHVLLVADSCFSGYFMTTRGVLDWDQWHFLTRRSRVVLSATTATQTARDGRFTAALIDQLRRLDGAGRPVVASVYDLFGPIRKGVSDDSAGNMKPQLAQVGGGEGMFVFIPTAISREEIELDLKKLDAGDPATGDSGLIVAAGLRRGAELRQATQPGEVYALLNTPDYRWAVDAESSSKEWAERFERFLRNAQGGDGWAMAGLHFCYSIGLGAERSPVTAYHWARQADRVKSPPGLGRYLLGRSYDAGYAPTTGVGAEQVSRQLFRDSAEAGFILGRRALALRTLESTTATGDEIVRARQVLREAIDQGVLAAEVNLGLDLLKGRPSVPVDRPGGLVLLERAAARGDPYGQYELARAYLVGTAAISPEQRKSAEGYLRKAADRGVPEALTKLGFELRLGPKGRLGLDADDPQAFTLLDRAAQSGYPPALLETARMLARGVGVNVDPALARDRLLGAVKAGLAEAEFTRGLWQLDGFVLPQSEEGALASFTLAADKGNPDACFMAGNLLCEGRGFKVRPRWEGKTDPPVFHLHWSSGLHYLTRARELGVKGRPQTDYMARALNGFDAALREDEEIFARCYPGLVVHKGSEVERKFWFLPYATASTQIAREWRNQHPESFTRFCSDAGIDPKMLRTVGAK